MNFYCSQTPGVRNGAAAGPANRHDGLAEAGSVNCALEVRVENPGEQLVLREGPGRTTQARRPPGSVAASKKTVLARPKSRLRCRRRGRRRQNPYRGRRTGRGEMGPHAPVASPTLCSE